MSPLLLVPIDLCDGCGEPALLFARTLRGRLCVKCWKALKDEAERWLSPPKRKGRAA